MPNFKTKVASLKEAEIPTENFHTIIEDSPRGIDPSRHYYRVIIGANGGSVATCYRKDKQQGFKTGNVDFNSVEQTNDMRFVFNQVEIDNLFDHLNYFYDEYVYLIARMGQIEIDPISLLPM